MADARSYMYISLGTVAPFLLDFDATVYGCMLISRGKSILPCILRVSELVCSYRCVFLLIRAVILDKHNLAEIKEDRKDEKRAVPSSACTAWRAVV